MSSKSNDKLPKYVFRTEFGVFRFKRNVPSDIKDVSGKRYYYKVLGKSYKDAMKQYSGALKEFDAFVASFRQQTPARETILEIVANEYGSDAAQRLERGQIDDNLDFALQDLSARVEGKVSQEVSERLFDASLPPAVLTMNDCLNRYIEYKYTGNSEKDRLPRNLVERTGKYLREALGSSAVDELPVEEITRKDANKLRDYLVAQMKPNSVVRIIGQARTALNFVIKEDDLNIRNPFQGIIIKGAGASKDDRLPLTEQEVVSLNAVFDKPDDVSALWATLRDTGARLSEVVYLTVGDIDLQDRTMAIRPNALREDLKTVSSTRTIPLSDDAMNKLQVLRKGKEDDDAIFTRYAKPRGADNASQMLMKRLRKQIKDPKKSIHSLRHSMKDKLRNAGVQEELAKAIMGHSDGSVASRYGSGYNKDVMLEALVKVW